MGFGRRFLGRSLGFTVDGLALTVLGLLTFPVAAAPAYDALRIANSVFAAFPAGVTFGSVTITDINGRGDVSFQARSGVGPSQTFAGMYSGGTRLSSVLPSLAAPPSATPFGTATSVNDGGIYAGMRAGAYVNSGGTTVSASWAFLANSAGLTAESLPYRDLNGFDVNNRGDWLLSGGLFNQAGNQVTVRQASNGVVFTLSAPAGYQSATAWDINNNGAVLGMSQRTVNGNTVSAPTVWAHGFGYTLPQAASTGPISTFRINDSNWVAGTGVYGDHNEATLWRGQQAIRIGVLPGFVGSVATDINNLGQVVGYSYKLNSFGLVSERAPFLWDRGRMTDLRTATLTDPTSTSAFQISTATALNDLGQIGGAMALKLNPNQASAAVLSPKALRGNGSPDNLIVLTHGWKPDARPTGGEAMLPEIQAAVNQRLAPQIAAGNVTVLDHYWAGGTVSATGLTLPGLPTSPAPWLETEQARRLEIVSQGFEKLGLKVPTVSELVQGGLGYGLAYVNAVQEGKQLGRELATYIKATNDSRINAGNAAGYNPTLHFVGADLGSVVNAYAVNELNSQGINATSTPIQFTVLNTPPVLYYNGLSDGTIAVSNALVDAKRAALANSAAFFYYLSLGKSVSYVDNYYTDKTDYLIPISGATFAGQAIAGAGPCVAGGCAGQVFRGRTGTELQTQLYPDIVAGNDLANAWTTPALANGAFPYAWNPDAAKQSIVDVVQSIRPGTVYLQAPLLEFGLNSDLPTAVNVIAGEVLTEKRGSANFLRLLAQSPVAFSVTQNVDGQMFMEFDYDMTLATGGEFGVAFEGQLLWGISAEDDAAVQNGHAVIALTNIAGDGSFTFLYNSSFTGSSVAIGNITMHGIAPVPEPGALLLMLAGLAIIGRRASRWPSS